MHKKITIIIAIAGIITFIGAFTFAKPAQEAEVNFPEGYRMWTHIKTGLIGPTSPFFQFSGGFHHIYANDLAMQGYTSGYFPNGSIIVFDVLEANEANGSTLEGNRRHVDVMVRDSIKYVSTGGWGYEEFKLGDKVQRVLTPAAKTQCSNCHARQSDHVFSDFRK